MTRNEAAESPIFRVLQSEVKLCNFSSRYLMTEEMKMIDTALEVFNKQEEIARNFLKDGVSEEKVARNTGVPLYMVREMKEKMK